MRFRRPVEMTRLRLDAYEYKVIGEIVVLSGIIEQTIKELPLLLLRVRTMPGIAFTAHQNFQAVCDMVRAMLPHAIADKAMRASLNSTLETFKGLYAERNKIIHGPFWPHEDSKGTFRITARGKKGIAFDKSVFDRNTLPILLQNMSAALDALWIDVAVLEMQADEEERANSRSLIHESARKINRRKSRTRS